MAHKFQLGIIGLALKHCLKVGQNISFAPSLHHIFLLIEVLAPINHDFL